MTEQLAGMVENPPYRVYSRGTSFKDFEYEWFSMVQAFNKHFTPIRKCNLRKTWKQFWKAQLVDKRQNHPMAVKNWPLVFGLIVAKFSAGGVWNKA